jgi:signal transduction histidine kinase
LSEPSQPEVKKARTEILYGTENAVGRGIEFMANVQKRMDITFDSHGPSIVVEIPAYWNGYLDIIRRGASIRVVTEITQANVRYCKQIAKIAQVRHLNGMIGGIAMNEKEYMATTTLEEAKPLTQVIYSNVDDVVRQGECLFESLWDNAIPSEDRIREIEEGAEPERTKIIYGSDRIRIWTAEFFSKTKETLDSCMDANTPEILFENEDLRGAYLLLRDRGIRLRCITEITQDNLSYCKQLMRIADVRHLDRLKGTFGIADKKKYAASGIAHHNGITTRLIVSSIRPFVEIQQFSFQALWEKATVAEQRIRQIEEGWEPEYIKTVDNRDEVLHTALEIIEKAQEEIRLIFSTPNAFRRQDQEGGTRHLLAAAREHNLSIRILIPFEKGMEEEVEGSIRQLSSTLGNSQKVEPDLAIRYLEPAWRTSISLVIADTKFALAIESKDDTKTTVSEAIGLATLSNSKATVSSYISMFESLWMQSEIHEKLKARSKMQQEFINIAAHELRSPIQPILGLSDILYHKTENNEQRELVGIIMRNARRLQKLAENILDITKIEGQMLKLYKQEFDLKDLVADALRDFKNSQGYKEKEGKVQLFFQRENGNEDNNDSIIVEADKEKIRQVIRNLLNNAFEFTKEGTVTVRVAKAQNPGGKNDNGDDDIFAAVSIRDTGVGIAPEVLPVMFEKFVSLSERGTGLGLFISKGIVEAHQGKIWGENNSEEKKEGATFTFTLPLKDRVLSS